MAKFLIAQTDLYDYLYSRNKIKVKPLKNKVMEKKSFRFRVMKYAHHMYSTTKNSWASCLKKAWELYRLAKQMRHGIVNFMYVKVDGTIREACGTLSNLPAGRSLNGKHMTKTSYKTFAYFDIEKGEMRCFKIENLLTAF